MRIRPDGSIQSGNTPTHDNLNYTKDASIYRCLVIQTNFVNDQNFTVNASNPRVLYDVVILGGALEGHLLTDCRLLTELGNNTNYREIVLKASSKTLNEVPLQDHDGDIVFVAFVQGDQNYPVIIGLDSGLNTGELIGAKPEDGIREIRNFNGIKVETNSVGEYSLSRQGGVLEEGSLKEDSGDPKYKLELLDKEILKQTFLSGMTQEYDGEADSITKTFKGGLTLLEDGKNDTKIETFNGGMVVSSDGASDSISRTFTNGLVVTEDGVADKVTIATSGGAIVVVDGPGGKITLTHGATIIELDANTGKIALKGDFVDLGTAVSDFAVLAIELASAFNSHLHQAPQAPSGTLPTTPPVAPLPPSVWSTTVKVQP